MFNIDVWKGTTPEDEIEVVTADMELVAGKAKSILAEIEAGKDVPTEALDKLRLVTQQLRYDIAVREPFAPDGEVDIQVTTLWSAKGITADHVYVLGLTEQTLPGTKREEYPGTETDYQDEQRRLFYVSITRSKNTLVLSRSSKIKRNDAARLGMGNLPGTGPVVPLTMSPFLRSITRFLPDVVKGDAWRGCTIQSH